jgi:hypothetical protein
MKLRYFHLVASREVVQLDLSRGGVATPDMAVVAPNLYMPRCRSKLP